MQEISVNIIHRNRSSQESSIIYECKGVLWPKSLRTPTLEHWLSAAMSIRIISGSLNCHLWVLPLEILFSLVWGAAWTSGFLKDANVQLRLGTSPLVRCWRCTGPGTWLHLHVVCKLRRFLFSPPAETYQASAVFQAPFLVLEISQRANRKHLCP